MRFGYSQGLEEIFIKFNPTDEAIQSLIDGGYLDEDIKSTYGYEHRYDTDYSDSDDDEFTNAVIDAVIDWITDKASDRDYDDDYEDPFHDSSNDVVRAEYILNENRWFNQFLSYSSNAGGF